MKHIIETTSEIQNLTRWRGSRFNEMNIILFARVHPDGKTRTGDYAKYLVVGKEKGYVILNKIK